MTKSGFRRYCERSTTPPRVRWGSIYRSPEYAVFLDGCWANGAMTDVQLYQPTPGRQWELGRYATARASCEREAAKYARWLAEWKQRNTGAVEAP